MSHAILLVLLIFRSCPSIADGALKPINIAIGEWKPYVSQELEGYGELTQKITLVLERMGYRPNYLFMPWGQAEKLVRNNAENSGPRGTFPFLKVDDRVKQYYFSEKPILKECIVFFYNKEKLKHGSNGKHELKSLGDLTNYKLGFIKSSSGYRYPKDLQEILESNGTVVDSAYHLFRKLIDSNELDIQVVPAVKVVGLDLLLESFPEEQGKIGVLKEVASDKECYLPEDYHFMTSRLNTDNAEFIHKFNQQFEALSKLGAIEIITDNAKQQPSLRKPAVVLTSDPSESYIKGHSDNKEYLLPRGTKGLLLAWKPNDNNDRVEARVYILTYPYRGTEVTVEGRYIELQ